MIRLATIMLAVAGLASAATAQDSAPLEPRLEMQIDETEAISGQPLSVRLTVLTPTFFPSPPVWPSYEAPNLLVTLPGRATSPTSKTIDGRTWAGISRRYQITPMVPGRFDLPAQTVTVTWADPETNEPTTTDIATEPITLNGLVPEGAEGLDPFIAADALTLTEEVSGDPEAMTPGASVTRTVTATITGTSPIFLPPLIPGHVIDGVRAYPDEPVVEAKEERGILSGSRTERITLVAAGGGHGEAPAIAIDWYNLKTKAVETARVDGFSVNVSGPPIAAAEPRNWRLIIVLGALALFGAALLVWIVRWMGPRLIRAFSAWRLAWRQSEPYAFRALRQVVSRRDYGRLYHHLDTWAVMVEGADPRDDPRVDAALIALGATRYGGAKTSADTAWRSLDAALRRARKTVKHAGAERDALPALNPHPASSAAPR